MTSIRQENPVMSVKTLLLKRFKFLKEGRNMNNTPRSNEIDCTRIYETWYCQPISDPKTRFSTRWENMEIVLDISDDNGMSRIISSLEINFSFCVVKMLYLTSGDNVNIFAKDVNEFPFSFVSPLRSDCRIVSIIEN